MRYAIADVEATGLPGELALAPDEEGLALLVRRHGRPIHFSLHALAAGAALDAPALKRLVADAAGIAVVEEAVRDELAEPVAPRPIALTAAICTRGRPDLVEACLRGLLEARSGAEGGSLELLVVDNDPPDGRTAEVAAAFPSVRYVREPLPGLDFARNRALAEARGEYVAFVDDDVVVDRGWRAGIEEALSEHPDAAVVTGLVVPLELATEAQVVFERRGGFRRGFQKLRYAGQTMPGNPLYPTGAGIFGAGCNMVVHRETVLALGGFDEALDTGPPLPGGGDLDVFYRVIRAGHPLVYEPRMLAFHRHRRERRALRRQYRSWGEGFMAFVEKTYGWDVEQRPKLRRIVRWWLGDQLGTVRRAVVGRSELPADLALAELAGGLVGLTGAYRRSRRRVEGLRRRRG